MISSLSSICNYVLVGDEVPSLNAAAWEERGVGRQKMNLLQISRRGRTIRNKRELTSYQ